jgi:hypothetical protein
MTGAVAQEAYVTGGAGVSTWNYDCGPNGCKRQASAWRAGGGYRFNRVVALEGFYFDFGRARSSDYSVDGSLGARAFGVQGLIGWQFGDFDLDGKIGIAKVRATFDAAPTSGYESSRASHNEVIGGLVLAYRVAPSVSIRLDVDIVTVALISDVLTYSRGSDVVTYVLGVMLKF